MRREIVIPVTTSGGAGVATGSGDSDPIFGEILAVRVDYQPGAPATTKVDVDELGGAARKILNKAASNTDAVHHPRLLMQDTAGANLTAWYEPVTLAGRKARVSVTLSDALAPAVIVTLIVKE